MYYYGMPNTNYGCGCVPQGYCCQENGKNKGYSYALILVLFILLVIIGAARWY